MRRLSVWFSYLGPGIITAALVFGPGSLTLTSKLGSAYQYQLLWVIVAATILMMSFTGMSARIGVMTQQSLLQTFRIKWGDWTAWATGIGIFLVTASFQAGNSIGAGIAFAETFDTPAPPWIWMTVAAGMSLLFFKSFYQILEKVMMIMVGLMLFSFVLTVVITRPSFTGILQGLIPRLPSGSLLLVVGLVASSFSIVGAFYQSYLVQEKAWKPEQIRPVIRESLTGIFILGFISAMVLISAGAVLYSQDIEVKTATDMGLALQPLFGSLTSYLFMLGLFAASFSSLVGNATIGGTLFSDALSLGRDLSSRSVRLSIFLIMFIGAFVAVVFGKLPLELIVIAQGVTIFIVPFIGLAIFLTANDGSIMGPLRNNLLQNIIGMIGLLVLFGLATGNFINLFL